MINFLEQLTELKRKLLLTRLPAHYERYNSGTATRERCPGQGLKREDSAGRLCPQTTTRSPTRKFPQPPSSFFFFLSWRLYYVGPIDKTIDHWGLSQRPAPSPLLGGRRGMGLQVQTLGASGWFPWQPAPSLRCIAKVTSLTRKLP